jgi:hypothetical protein
MTPQFMMKGVPGREKQKLFNAALRRPFSWHLEAVSLFFSERRAANGKIDSWESHGLKMPWA